MATTAISSADRRACGKSRAPSRWRRACVLGTHLTNAIGRHGRLAAAIDAPLLCSLDARLLALADESALHLGDHAEHRHEDRARGVLRREEGSKSNASRAPGTLFGPLSNLAGLTQRGPKRIASQGGLLEEWTLADRLACDWWRGGRGGLSKVPTQTRRSRWPAAQGLFGLVSGTRHQPPPRAKVNLIVLV